MNALINIQETDGVKTVNARELWEFLEVKSDFNNWIKRRISDYDFKEGVDYSTIVKKNDRQTLKEYHISLDMAKELAMVERNEKGKQARQYFIAVEKAHLENIKPALSFEEQVIATLSMAKEKVKALEMKVEEDAPKVDFHDTVTGSDTVCQMAVAADVADLGIGRNTLFKKLREKGVLISGGERHNMPKQRYISQGLFTVKESVVKNPKTDQPIIVFATHVTQRGIEWLIKHYKIATA